MYHRGSKKDYMWQNQITRGEILEVRELTSAALTATAPWSRFHLPFLVHLIFDMHTEPFTELEPTSKYFLPQTDHLNQSSLCWTATVGQLYTFCCACTVSIEINVAWVLYY